MVERRWPSGSGISRVAALAAALALAGCQSPEVGGIYDTKAGEPREEVRLSVKDADHLRAGMRAYLAALRGITEATADRDYEAVAEAAREVGMTAVANVSLLTVAKLPAQFILLATDTHEKFDGLADLAQKSNARGISGKLSEILANCTACHDTYRLVAY